MVRPQIPFHDRKGPFVRFLRLGKLARQLQKPSQLGQGEGDVDMVGSQSLLSDGQTAFDAFRA